MNRLSLQWRLRPGKDRVGRFGGSQTERRYIDFAIDGSSLGDRVQRAFGDVVGVLGWQRQEDDEQAVGELILRRPSPPVLQGRVALFVCPECAGIDCGAVTVRITRSDDAYKWAGFTFENDYDPAMTDSNKLESLGPFLFEPAHYESLLQRFLNNPRAAHDYD